MLPHPGAIMQPISPNARSITHNATARNRHYFSNTGEHRAVIYYARMQIVITICNPPSLTAGGAQRR